MGENGGLRGRNPALGAAGSAVEGAQKSDMIHTCHPCDDRAGCGMRIAFWDSKFDRAEDLRRPACPHPLPDPPVTNTARGTCGRVQRGWHNRTPRRRVRDLACGGLRTYLGYVLPRL